ncbi:hypothetical protein IVB14_04530 [Bradyrhizobium sp. 180]|uniref:hypothetical protein n=1 Tax=Bradyrhizobium sp. 180 TaxID=2782650 RepID=UPI001FFBA49D|nr:hypothetical protein [Bradyrhizobium sp. 180]MCK1489707.1 hypothetical protein [Bradyrhizobium sp. 180]
MIGEQILTLAAQRELVDNQKPSYPISQGSEPTLGYAPLGPVKPVRQSAVPGQHTSVPRGMFETFINTCQRWGLSQSGQLTLLGYDEQDFLGSQLLMGHVPARTRDVKDRIGFVLAISLGLGTIFDEAVAPEVRWLSTEHPKLRESPLRHMLRGGMVHLTAVSNLVSIERNL